MSGETYQKWLFADGSFAVLAFRPLWATLPPIRIRLLFHLQLHHLEFWKYLIYFNENFIIKLVSYYGVIPTRILAAPLSIWIDFRIVAPSFVTLILPSLDCDNNILSYLLLLLDYVKHGMHYWPYHSLWTEGGFN